MLSLPRVWVQYLVGKLRSYKLSGTAKKKKKKGVLFKNKNTITKDYGVFIHSTDT